MSTIKPQNKAEPDDSEGASGASASKPGATPKAVVSNHRRLWIGAGASALLAGTAISAWRMHDSQPQDEAVQTLMQQSYPLVSGSLDSTATGSMALSTLKGKTVMLNFWATWCPPCIEEMPDLSRLAETWAKEFGEKVVTLGIGIDSIANIQKFSQKLPVSYPLLSANAQGLELLRLLGNSSGGLPFSIIVSPRGLIAERILGRFDVKSLDLSVRKVLAGKI